MKHFYTLLAGVLATTSAFAVTVTPLTREQSVIVRNPQKSTVRHKKAPMKETSDVIPADMWGYNCGVASWVKTSQNASNDFVLASEFGADVADALAGKSISSLGVIAPVFDTPTKADMTLFITYDLDDAPLAEVTVSTTGCPLTSDGYIAATPVEIGKIAESIKIEKGKPFYVGFKMNKVAADAYPIPFDGVAYSGGEGIIFKSKETENKWMILNDSY